MILFLNPNSGHIKTRGHHPSPQPEQMEMKISGYHGLKRRQIKNLKNATAQWINTILCLSDDWINSFLHLGA